MLVSRNAGPEITRNWEVSLEMTYDARDYTGEGNKARVIEFPARSSEMPENVSVANETSQDVWLALRELPDNYRAVLVLHHMEGMSYAEIARVLGVPRNTAKTWGHRARAILCESLEGVI